MSSDQPQPGFREVKPPKRKQKDTPSRRARDARRLTERIETKTGERQQIWRTGKPQPDRTETLTTGLEQDHREKCVMRRELYAKAPELEGTPYKGTISVSRAGRV